jgi:uncharacterized coiled-coil protein SlyX
MDISGMSVEQLKALGYDIRVEIEQSQNSLRTVEKRILQLNRETAAPTAQDGNTKPPEAPDANAGNAQPTPAA